MNGILFPLFALNGTNNSGIGTTSDLKEAILWAKNHKFEIIQLLPIQETGNDHSPYNAISSYAIEPTTLDVGLRFNNTEVDYDTLKPQVLNKLRLIYECLSEHEKINAHIWSKKQHWIEDYLNFKDGDNNFLTWIQYHAHIQWIDVKDFAIKHNVKLMGDIPFGISRYSADVSANPDLFTDWSGGAPPETQFQGDRFLMEYGQNWGVPLYNWEHPYIMEWWKKRLVHQKQIFDFVRIDHILGFYRIYGFPWNPDRNHEFLGLSKDEVINKVGDYPHYCPFPDDTQNHKDINNQNGTSRLNILKEVFPGLVGEDLGTVPDYVANSLKSLDIPGFKIPQWEKNNIYDECSLATFTTHDMPPLAIWWMKLVKLCKWANIKYDTFANVRHQLIKHLFNCNSRIKIINMPDLLGTNERFNMPGTSGNHNWSKRLPNISEWDSYL